MDVPWCERHQAWHIGSCEKWITANRDTHDDLILRVKELLAAQAKMLEAWAELRPDDPARRELWEGLHCAADRVRDELGEPY